MDTWTTLIQLFKNLHFSILLVPFLPFPPSHLMIFSSISPNLNKSDFNTSWTKLIKLYNNIYMCTCNNFYHTVIILSTPYTHEINNNNNNSFILGTKGDVAVI